MIKVQQMTSNNGNKVANQFIIDESTFIQPDDSYTGTAFQSYDTVIAFKAYECGNTGNCYKVFLDAKKWDYSTTTGKYRNQFLDEGIAETRKKIKSGEYTLANLN